jgi:ribosomal protein L11 methyltransferase
MRAFRVVVPAADEESATAALWEAGTSGIEVRPAATGELDLLAYFPDETDAAAVARVLPDASVEPVPLPDVDWVARFREGFRAFQAGRFRIVPVWDSPAAAPGVLVVDPGRAFGTGTHETTRLCLAAIEGLAARRRLGRTLDLGSGTGLLAIAAWQLGAVPVIASDIDPEATASSRLHARLNEAPVAVFRADGGRGFRAGIFDLVVANLMAPLLIERADEIRRLLAPAGVLVLSGLLRDDAPAVSAAFAACGPAAELHDGEWVALVFETRR